VPIGYLVDSAIIEQGREHFRQTFYRLPFPLRGLIGVNAVLIGNLVDRSLPLDRFQGDLGLEFRGKGFSLHFHCVHRSSGVSSDITTLIRGLAFWEYYDPLGARFNTNRMSNSNECTQFFDTRESDRCCTLFTSQSITKTGNNQFMNCRNRS